MNCGPHSNPTPANGHQISLSAYKEAKEETATELKIAMAHLMYQKSVLSSSQLIQCTINNVGTTIDDIVILSSSYSEMQGLLEAVNRQAAAVGMCINASKVTPR